MRNLLENIIRRMVNESIDQIINEGPYDKSTNPIFGRSMTTGNPLYPSNGGHSAQDHLVQASTIDFNGANFKGETVVLNPGKLKFYKAKNFGNPDILGTKAVFGNSKLMRNAIDTVYGGAQRGDRDVKWRAICGEDSKSSDSKFYEFSLDDGANWYILVPKPLQTMKPTSLKQ